ncbi:TPA: transcriptional regulator [Pseudomonas aeruginosa]|nr:transcriptional regulator [Pseudomonas aeruginosa]
MTHDWDLVERLLLEVRQSAHENFAPRAHAERLAEERSQAGQRVGDMDALKQKAADYEAILLEGGFIEPRAEEQGGNGENFVLTPRGERLLGLIGGETPKAAEALRLLEENGSEALHAERFDRFVAGL